MRKIGLFILLFLILPSILAIDLEVEKLSSNEVIISELGQAATFDLKITNNEASDVFTIYNLLGFETEPKTIQISEGETKNLEVKVYLRDNFDYRGIYTLEYFIKNSKDESQQESLTFEVIDLEGVFIVGSGEISPETNSMEVFIQNKVNFDFDNVAVNFKSAFFELDKKFSLEPYGKKIFDVELDKEDFNKLMAGFYTLSASIEVENEKTDVEGVIKFVEKDILETSKKSYGFIINTELIRKVNEGNVVARSETLIKKNILSRLFTSFSPEPDVVNREGFNIHYTWTNQINPGETLEIVVKTNWLLPLLIIFFVVVIVFFAKQYSKTNVSLRKRVSFVRTKGGEFALKVSIFVSAKTHVETVSVIDRLPPMMKVYEKFGNEKPVRVNEHTRRIEWDLDNLEAGETRVLSYVVYSKMGVMGKFALPEATAIYEKDGKIHETESNRTFFVAEQRKKDLEED